MLTQELKSKINWLWDRFWAGGLSNPITAIEQISYLLFMRRLEHVDRGKFFSSNQQNLKWSNYRELSPDSLLKHMKNDVFPFIKSLKDEHEPFTLAMENAGFMIEKPTLLKEAVEVIDEIYAEIERQQLDGQHFQDTQGDLYEHLLKATSEAGKNGQFRTPRHIIQMMCEILDPDVGDKICDITCGTAGFLVGAYQHILNKYSSENLRTEDENGFDRSIEGDLLTPKQRAKLMTKTFYGFDIDPTMIRIGLMNLIMHGITEPQIVRQDTLSQKYDEYENGLHMSKMSLKAGLTQRESKDYSDEQYTAILANPPFTGRIDKSQFSIKLNRIDSKQSELLFLLRMIHMLKPEGKAAVIVPEGVLFGTAKAQKTIRQILLKDCKLDAVISLPSGAFQPYTGVKTSIIVFTKKQLYSEKYHTQKVWFYGLDNDGYTLDSSRKKLKENPLPNAVKTFKNKDVEEVRDRKKHFYVPISEIEENGFELSYNQYKEFIYEEQEYEPPYELISKLIKMEEEILTEMNALQKLL